MTYTLSTCTKERFGPKAAILFGVVIKATQGYMDRMVEKQIELIIESWTLSCLETHSCCLPQHLLPLMYLGTLKECLYRPHTTLSLPFVPLRPQRNGNTTFRDWSEWVFINEVCSLEWGLDYNRNNISHCTHSYTSTYITHQFTSSD